MPTTRHIFIIISVCLLFCLLMGCNVTKGKQSRDQELTRRDSVSLQTTATNLRTERGSGEERGGYDRETIITPTIVRDTINNVTHIHPTTVIREKGETVKEYVYENKDSTRIDQLQQSMLSLIEVVREQSKHKQTTNNIPMWIAIGLNGALLIYLLVKKRPA